jgi:hypothetical protein
VMIVRDIVSDFFANHIAMRQLIAVTDRARS